jgi:hypothetical protein
MKNSDDGRQLEMLFRQFDLDTFVYIKLSKTEQTIEMKKL